MLDRSLEVFGLLAEPLDAHQEGLWLARGRRRARRWPRHRRVQPPLLESREASDRPGRCDTRARVTTYVANPAWVGRDTGVGSRPSPVGTRRLRSKEHGSARAGCSVLSSRDPFTAHVSSMPMSLLLTTAPRKSLKSLRGFLQSQHPSSLLKNCHFALLLGDVPRGVRDTEPCPALLAGPNSDCAESEHLDEPAWQMGHHAERSPNVAVDGSAMVVTTVNDEGSARAAQGASVRLVCPRGVLSPPAAPLGHPPD